MVIRCDPDEHAYPEGRMGVEVVAIVNVHFHAYAEAQAGECSVEVEGKKE